MRRLKKCIALLLFGNMLIGGTNSLADTDKLVVSMGLKEEFNDNLFFSANQKLDDFITTLSPGVELLRKDERTSASLKGLLDVVMYSKNSALNNVDQLYSASIFHALTTRLRLSGKASYKRDSRPDRDFEETGIVLDTDVRKIQRYNAGLGYVLSEKASVNIKYNHYRDDYVDPAATDSDAHKVNVQLKYNLNYWFPRVVGRLTSEYNRYNYPTTGSDNYNLTLGVERALTEIYSFYADLGGRYTNPDDGSGKFGNVVRCGVKFNGELTNWSATLTHDMLPTSGSDSLRERTFLVASVQRKISDSFKGTFKGGYYFNKSDNTDKTTITLNPSLGFRVAEHVRLQTGYQYSQVVDKVTSGDITSDRNLVYVNLFIAQPFFD